jgi:hypothetical protein
LQQSVERSGKIESFFDDGDQQVDRDGDPELGFDGVFAGSIEGLDAQVLLDPLEEQLSGKGLARYLRRARSVSSPSP